jgi:hypothetical protein
MTSSSVSAHVKHLADESSRDSFAAWFAPLAFLHVADEGEPHMLWLANHAAAFWRALPIACSSW